MRILMNIREAPIISGPSTSKEAETRLGVIKLCVSLRGLHLIQ